MNSESNYITGVLYATTIYTNSSKALLKSAVDAFLATRSEDAQLLYSAYYEQQQHNRGTEGSSNGTNPSLDLAFDDSVLEDVAAGWKAIVGNEVDESEFMKFEERPGMHEDENDYDNEY